MSTLLTMLAECAPAADDSVPAGLLRQISNGHASDEWFADENYIDALTFRDGVWCRGSCLMHRICGTNAYLCIMTPRLLVIQGVVALCNWCCKPIGGLVLSVMCGSMCQLVIIASAIRHLMRSLQGRCNHCLCLSLAGSG